MSALQGSSRLHWEHGAVVGVLLLWGLMLSLKIGVGLIAGLAVFALTRFAQRAFTRWFAVRALRVSSAPLRFIVLALPTVFTTVSVVLVVALLSFGVVSAVRFLVETLAAQGPQLLEEAVRSLGVLAAKLPEALRNQIPATSQELYVMLGSAAGDLVAYAKSFGGASFFVLLQLVFALILGVSAALGSAASPTVPVKGPLARYWLEACERYVRCFTLLMGAQVYVSLWNTFCTAVFIYFILPAVDVVLPFRELLLIFTAVASLIPAAGNVMANTLILVLTLRYGPLVSIGSVVYLFVIHKVEYFVNGYIIGRNVQASVPEMLIAIILGEMAFGLPGLITAPVTYAFLKMYWQKWTWV
jgi:predicted PurR-regulated permease PerM